MSKRISSRRLTLIAALSFAVGMALVGNSAPAQSKGRATPISKEQVKERLKSLRNRGITIFYPEFVPARFSLVSVRTDPESECKNLDYELKFCDKNRLCFSLESECGGIGDSPGGDRALTGKSKLFGAFQIDVFKPWSDGNGTRHIYYLSEWLRDDRLVITKKTGVNRNRNAHSVRFHHFLGHGVTDREALAIVKSLRPLE